MSSLLLCIVFDNNIVIVLKIHLEDLLECCHLTDSVPRPRRDQTMEGRTDVSRAPKQSRLTGHANRKPERARGSRVAGPAGLPKSINAGGPLKRRRSLKNS